MALSGRDKTKDRQVKVASYQKNHIFQEKNQNSNFYLFLCNLCVQNLDLNYFFKSHIQKNGKF